MASSYLKTYPVPQGFYEILADLTHDILRDQPTNIVEYAALYFERRDKSFTINHKYFDFYIGITMQV